jgi:glucose/arabinose dehydrogenase
MRPELWNWGLRNPWRFSFDRLKQDLFIGDVGQDEWEEIDVHPFGTSYGPNFGWNLMEGAHCFTPRCTNSGLELPPEMPLIEYNHNQGCSVIGGYVYRGSAIPQLYGHYLYSDYCGGWVRSLRWVAGEAISRRDRDELSHGGNVTSFGEDARGELYILTQDGRVHRIVPR